MGKEIEVGQRRRSDILERLPDVGRAFIAQRAGQLRRFLSRYGHVNSSDSPQPNGDVNDQVKEKLYVPQKFALGPFYHRPDSNSDEFELFKEGLIIEHTADCHFEELVNNMRADVFVSEVRAWYARLQCPLINEEDRRRKMDLYSDNDLARMMARDGLFLLEFLRSLQNSNGLSEMSWLAEEFPVQEDVMRIVNQIPFFVLKCILQREAVRDKDKDEDEANKQAANTDQVLETLLKHASLKLSPIEYDSDSHDSHVKARVPRSDSHLLEFVYEDIISASDIKSRYKWRRKSKITLPQAVELADKGVKFAPNRGLLSEIRFDWTTGTLYLPVIKMDGKTEALLTNMVKFEASKQGQGQASQPLISYVDLMERLIDNDKDVQALRDGGIIQCHLSTNKEVADVWNRMRNIQCDLSTNQEVADVWNRMRKLLPDRNMFKYEPIDYAINDVKSFYKNKCKSIHRSYFSNPSLGIYLAAACMLLGLTVFQTYLAWETYLAVQRISMHKP